MKMFHFIRPMSDLRIKEKKTNTQLENEDMGFLAMWIMFEHRDYDT